jgi:outer membrane putative beta-barrel porin/alpha-amylase
MKFLSLMRCATALMILLAIPLGMARAEEPLQAEPSPCRNPTVTSVPSRPTVANATDLTQCGVVEVEYGYDHQWLGAGTHRNDLTGGLRFGLTPNLDLHWSSASFLNVVDGAGSRSSFGDAWLGLKYRFLVQKKHRPSLGLYYAAKVPTASFSRGMGSGQVDHSFSLLASKDVTHIHFDFNVIGLLIGRTSASGVDHNLGFALSAYYPLTRRLNLVVEPYGYTLLNESTPAFASTMGGFTYQVGPRIYLDAGFDVGVTHGAPNKRVFVGATYAIANLYSWMNRR